MAKSLLLQLLTVVNPALLRGIAQVEPGQPQAHENLTVIYVNGEGVKCDGVAFKSRTGDLFAF